MKRLKQCMRDVARTVQKSLDIPLENIRVIVNEVPKNRFSVGDQLKSEIDKNEPYFFDQMFTYKNIIFSKSKMKEFDNMNAQLNYELRSPEHIEPGKKYPVIFLLHGMGSNEQNMMPLVSGIEKELFVFSIRGPLQQPPGYAFFTIQEYGNPHREVFDDAVNKLEDFIEYAVDKYPIDTEEGVLDGIQPRSDSFYDSWTEAWKPHKRDYCIKRLYSRLS